MYLDQDFKKCSVMEDASNLNLRTTFAAHFHLCIGRANDSSSSSEKSDSLQYPFHVSIRIAKCLTFIVFGVCSSEMIAVLWRLQ